MINALAMMTLQRLVCFCQRTTDKRQTSLCKRTRHSYKRGKKQIASANVSFHAFLGGVLCVCVCVRARVYVHAYIHTFLHTRALRLCVHNTVTQITPHSNKLLNANHQGPRQKNYGLGMTSPRIALRPQTASKDHSVSSACSMKKRDSLDSSNSTIARPRSPYDAAYTRYNQYIIYIYIYIYTI